MLGSEVSKTILISPPETLAGREFLHRLGLSEVGDELTLGCAPGTVRLTVAQARVSVAVTVDGAGPRRLADQAIAAAMRISAGLARRSPRCLARFAEILTTAPPPPATVSGAARRVGATSRTLRRAWSKAIPPKPTLLGVLHLFQLGHGLRARLSSAGTPWHQVAAELGLRPTTLRRLSREVLGQLPRDVEVVDCFRLVSLLVDVPWPVDPASPCGQRV